MSCGPPPQGISADAIVDAQNLDPGKSVPVVALTTRKP
jgi:hypothetical protein